MEESFSQKWREILPGVAFEIKALALFEPVIIEATGSEYKSLFQSS